ncbi:MAG: methylenetetrahydrofolate reductase [Actinomycetota bacterium]
MSATQPVTARPHLRDLPSHLAQVLAAGRFAVTAEAVPPRSGDGAAMQRQARALVGYADAVNVTDNPRASAHMSAVAGAAFLARSGIEPLVQMTTRDRNRLALSADLLSAWALGARGLLVLSGDRLRAGDHPDAVAVSDLTVLELVGLARRLRDEGTLLSGVEVTEAPRFLIAVADAPLVEGYDPARLEQKLDAGADLVQTQIAYDLEALRSWAEVMRSRGVFERAAVLIGVTPLKSAKIARFMDEKLYGVSVPRAMIDELEAAGEDAPQVGVRHAVDLVGQIRSIEGIAGVHLMGVGAQDVVRSVVEGAGLFPRPGR